MNRKTWIAMLCLCLPLLSGCPKKEVVPPSEYAFFTQNAGKAPEEIKLFISKDWKQKEMSVQAKDILVYKDADSIEYTFTKGSLTSMVFVKVNISYGGVLKP